MATLGERILEAIRYEPLDDDVLAARLGASSRQTVNQTARKLELTGRLERHVGPEGKIVNEWIAPGEVVPAVPLQTGAAQAIERLTSEDEVKESVRIWLAEQGFAVVVAMGHERGIDIDANLQRMSDPKATYALALPNNRRYRGLVKRLPALARQRIGLVVLWVDSEPGGPAVTADWPGEDV